MIVDPSGYRKLQNLPPGMCLGFAKMIGYGILPESLDSSDEEPPQPIIVERPPPIRVRRRLNLLDRHR